MFADGSVDVDPKLEKLQIARLRLGYARYAQDQVVDKTVAWGTDWDFDEPRLREGNCPSSDVDVDIVYTITNSLCGRSYQVTRKWEAKDECGNKDTCKQIVTILDSSAPTLSAMPNKIVECGEPWEFDPPTVKLLGTAQSEPNLHKSE